MAFAWRPSPESHSSIYTKLIGVDEPLRLTNDAIDDYGPAWSPDGQSVAYLRILSRERDGVFLVPAIGGHARKLIEIFPRVCPTVMRGNQRGIRAVAGLLSPMRIPLTDRSGCSPFP